MSLKLSVWHLGIIGGSLIICGILLPPLVFTFVAAGGLIPFFEALFNSPLLLITIWFGGLGIAIIIFSIFLTQGKLSSWLISLYSVAGVISLFSVLGYGCFMLAVFGMSGRDVLPSASAFFISAGVSIFIGLVGSMLALSGPLILHLNLKGRYPRFRE